MKSPHTSGRKGQARVADELRQQRSLLRLITRRMALLQVTMWKGLVECVTMTPPLHIMISTMMGLQRGLGLGVSRSIVHNSNHYKRAYEEEHKSHVALETEVDGLKSRTEDMEKIVASLFQSGTQMQSSTDHESSSRVRHNFTYRM